MTWTLETSCGYESAKIAAHIVQYISGGPYLDLGCGSSKVWPGAIGVDRFSSPNGADLVGEISDLSMFRDEHFQAVFSSHALEDFERERVPAVLNEWSRVIKPGGYLILYIPSANLYPTLGQPGANPDHKWDIYPGDVEWILRNEVNKDEYGEDGNWTLVESEERGETNEYSLFIVARKEAPGHGWKEDVWQRNPGGKKRALVIRYGAAIGDMVVASSIFPTLQRAGFDVTVNTTPDGKEVLLHDPHINSFVVQDNDLVPNQQLGPFWQQLAQRYDHLVNLCESIEGSLLTLEDRLTFHHTHAGRDQTIGKINYLERTHDIAGMPYEFASKFYETPEEDFEAKAFIKSLNAPVVVWVVTGSSLHKASPHIQHVVAWLLEKSPVSIVLLGDAKDGKQIGDTICDLVAKTEIPGKQMHRLYNKCGAWGRRMAVAVAKRAHCVVGPETGILNAVALEPLPKVVYLSHSSPANLTKHWVNTHTLTPPTDKAPCYPCHKLHYSWATCHQDPDTKASLCAAGVGPLGLFAAIADAMGAVRKVAAAEIAAE